MSLTLPVSLPKTVRAKAHREGTVFKTALENMKQDEDKVSFSPNPPYFNYQTRP